MQGAGWGSQVVNQVLAQLDLLISSTQFLRPRRLSSPKGAHQLVVPSAVVAPPVPLDQSGSILQLQEIGPETAA